MKFQLNSKELLERLQYLSGVVNSTNTMPILDNFLFEVEGQGLKVTASDLDNTMTAKLDVVADGNCLIAIPSKTLLEILKALPSQTIDFDVQPNNQIEIIASSGSYSIAYHDGKEFPKATELDDTETVTMKTTALETAIGKTIFACASDELRPIMNGVLFQIKKNSIVFVATDAHRLAKYERKDFTATNEVDFVVPKKPLQIIKGLLSATAGLEIEIQYNISNVVFIFEGYELKARLIDGKYPNYEAVIPKDNPNQIQIVKSELLGSLKRVAIFANKQTHQVAVKRVGEALNISAEDKDYSTNGTETLKCIPEGGDIEMGFNARFLAEALNNIDSNEVNIETSAPNRAGIVRPFVKSEGDEDLLMLVMPVMLTK